MRKHLEDLIGQNEKIYNIKSTENNDFFQWII